MGGRIRLLPDGVIDQIGAEHVYSSLYQATQDLIDE